MSIKCDSKLLVKPLFFLVIVDTINGFFLIREWNLPLALFLRRLFCQLLLKYYVHRQDSKDYCFLL